ncbi:hypothetical protein AUK22_11160 [bacterium CG2_30_54_10]|nr:MAG: hypothetical protein AUK22_11160 [bacterium CG2_30_54_10]
MNNVTPLVVPPPEVKLIISNGQVVASSLDVAKAFGKQHKNVLQSIEGLGAPADFNGLNFKPVEYKDAKGEVRPAVDMTRKGFTLLAMGFTGSKAMQFKIAYIDEFDRMEAELVKPALAPAIDPMTALNDPAAMRGLLLIYSEKVLTLQATVTGQAPKVAALDRIATSDGSLCLTDASKSLQTRRVDLISYLSTAPVLWIYKRAGCASWIGYQDKIQLGLVEHKVTTISHSDGREVLHQQVRITAKGMGKLSEVFAAVKRLENNVEWPLCLADTARKLNMPVDTLMEWMRVWHWIGPKGDSACPIRLKQGVLVEDVVPGGDTVRVTKDGFDLLSSVFMKVAV